MKIVLENEFDLFAVKELFNAWEQRKYVPCGAGFGVRNEVDAAFEEHGCTFFEVEHNAPPEYQGVSFDILVARKWVNLSFDNAVRLKELLGRLTDNKAMEKTTKNADKN